MPTTCAKPRPLLTADSRYDRSAIVSASWAMARAALVPARPMRGYTPPPLPSLRQAFKNALRRAWDLAGAQRACVEHRVAAEVETARRATLPAVERTVLTLRDARALAPMTDSTRGMVAELAAISAHAAALGVCL